MADKYSTIQQHQPLRIPAGWDKQEKALIVQLDEIFDDIYRRYGRLRLEDFGSSFRKRYEDTEGNVASLEFDVTGLTARVGTAEGNLTELTVGVTGLTTRVSNAEGDISALEVQADSIELSVANKYDKVSGITIEAEGIKLTGSKYIQLQSGSSIDIKTGGQFTIDSGNFAIDEQGNVTINGDGYFSGELRAATGTFAGTLDAGCITSGTMSANRISGGTIDATDVTITNLDASKITTGTLSANRISGGTIDASQINITNLSSNTYIQSVVGNWESQSTITQTVNSLNSRISSLGYGTVYYSETEPDHNNLIAGDVWIEPIEDNTWDDVAQYTWDELGGMTWEQVAGQYRMHVWTGTTFKLMFDNMIISELQTEINQNAYAITLKADESLVNQLSGQVTQFEATLEVQAEQIQSAVSSVNSKTANYIRLTDPSTDASITLSIGDTWTKAAGDGTWDSVGEYTWNQLADLTWDEIAGASVYTWDGSGWVQTADHGALLQNRTLITQTSEAVEILAEKTDDIDGKLVTTIANLTVANDRITQEVSRATKAEGGKLDKTSSYQTADSIVTAAQTYTNNRLTSYSTIEQTASAIELYVTNNAYKIVSGISILAEGITVSGSKYIKLNSGGYIDVNSGGLINIKSGAAFTVQSGNFTIDASGNVSLTGTITTGNGLIGSWAISKSWLSTGSGSSRVTLVGGSQGSTSAADWNRVKDYAFYAGASWPENAPFWVKKDGSFHASSGSFTGTVNATSGSFTGTVNATSGSFTGTVNATSGSFTGAVYATSGSFTGAVYATSGSFTGAVYASSGSFTGTVNATSGSFTGSITSKSGSIGSWNIAESWLKTGSNATCVTLVGGSQGDTPDEDWNKVKNYAMYAGASWPANAPFRLTKSGELTVTKLKVLDKNSQETEVNLRTAGLWKLNGASTIVSYGTDGGYCNRITLSSGEQINFKSAASVVVSATVSDAAYLSANNSSVTVKTFKDGVEYSTETHIINTNDAWTHGYTAGSPYGGVAIGARAAGTTYAATVTKRDGTTVLTMANCSTPYNDGVAAGEAEFQQISPNYNGALYDSRGLMVGNGPWYLSNAAVYGKV